MNEAQTEASSTGFQLNGRGEVAKFEELLANYVQARTGFTFFNLHLVESFDYAAKVHNGPRLFARLLDIHINYALMSADLYDAYKIWVPMFQAGKPQPQSLLADEELAVLKLEIHRCNTSFVLRYRALWDKYLGLLIEFFLPEATKRYEKAEKRKKAFAVLASSITDKIAPGFVEEVMTSLLEFDDRFRTPEAHGQGSIRKWSFSTDITTQNPQMQLGGYYNAANAMQRKLGQLLSGENPFCKHDSGEVFLG